MKICSAESEPTFCINRGFFFHFTVFEQKLGELQQTLLIRVTFFWIAILVHTSPAAGFLF